MAGFGQGADRTDLNALAAEGAGAAADRQAECRTDVGLKATVLCTQNSCCLDLLTNADAASAEDTFIGVAGDRL